MKDEDRALLLAFARNNMNLAYTGKEVYLNYNSVRYRLEKIHRETGLNPRNFYDLQKLLNMEE